MPWSKWPQSRSGSGLHSVDDNMVIMESSFPSVEKCFIIKYGLLLCTDFVVDPNHASKMNLTVEQPLFFPFHFSVYIELWGSCAVIGICGIKWIGWNWIGLNYRAWKPRIIFLSFTRVCTVPKYNPPLPSPSFWEESTTLCTYYCSLWPKPLLGDWAADVISYKDRDNAGVVCRRKLFLDQFCFVEHANFQFARTC